MLIRKQDCIHFIVLLAFISKELKKMMIIISKLTEFIKRFWRIIFMQSLKAQWQKQLLSVR